MKAVESRTAASTIRRANTPFFSKESDQHFFGSAQNEKPFFPSSKSRASSVQTKLNISQPNDHYEMEADSMADKTVQSLAEPAAIRTGPFSPASLMPFFQQKSTSSEEEKKVLKQEEEEDPSPEVKKLQRKPIFESNAEPPGDEIPIQKKADDPASQTANPTIESSLTSSKGSGHPLPEDTRQKMESSMGADFSDVRIHDDSNAAGLSKDLNAQAFTHGNDIYFNTGKYDTSSSGGQHLLAHELTHTIQQGASSHVSDSARISDSNNVVTTKLISPEESIHRSATSLAADVSVANKKGPDANRYGWQQLSDYQKTAPGPANVDVIKPNGKDIQPKAENGNIMSKPGITATVEKDQYEELKRKEEKEPLTAVQSKSEPGVQRLFGWVSDIAEWAGDKLDEGKKWVKDKVKNLIMNIKGYKALRVVLGSDPITGERVEQTGLNFIDAALDIIPFGSLIQQKLEELGILDQAAKFVEKAFGRVRKLISGISGIFSNFMDSLSLSDLKDIPAVFRRLEKAFTSFFDEIISFAKGIANDFLEFIKKALLIPLGAYIKTKTKFWDLLCLIIGKDPLTDEVKQPTGANILNAILNLSDEGIEQGKKMKETGTFNKVAAWIDRGIAVFSSAYEMLKAAFRGLWDIVSIHALMHPVETFLKIFDSFWKPIALIGRFFIDAGIAILKIVKEVLFKWISAKAKETKGFYLVTVLIAKDPFTGESVPRTTENIIKGFMMLSEGGEEQFNKMKESGAIDRTTAKIDAAIETLGFTWIYVKGLFISLWNSFGWKDLLMPVMAFAKIINTFKDPVLRLIRFVITVVVALFEVILRMMGFPVDLVFKLIENVKKAWASIKANPSGFLMNLLKAIKQGFTQFFDNILTHLWNGLKAWLKQELQDAGVPMPVDYTVMGIIKWLLLVLDITMEKIWTKLEKRVGKEKVDKIRSLIAKAEAIYDKANEALIFIEDVRKRGMDAIVDKIKEKLTNIWDMVLDAIKGFIMDQIIKKVTAKLLSMLDPTGIMAVINSAIALYKAIQSFIKYLARILEIVNSFVEGIIEICAGNIAVAANFLEKSLANGIPIVIGFLANQVGLDLSGRIRDVLATVREKVDKGLDFLIDKLVGFVENIIAKLKQAKDKILGWLGMKKPYTSEAGKNHFMYFKQVGDQGKLIMESDPMDVGTFLKKRKGEIPSDKTLDAAKKTDHLAKVDQAEKLVSDIETLTYPKDKKAPQDDKNEMDILSKSEALIELLKLLDPKGAAGVIPAPTLLPGFNGNKAQFMEVKYLSGYSDPKDPALPKPNYQEGEEASNYKGTLHGALTTLEGLGVRAKWVAFHIVNDNYGGKATDSNLVPAPQEINKNYLNEFEVELKTYLKNKETVWMKFNCQYKSTTPFLESMNATGGAMKFENNQWVEDTSKNKQFSTNVDPPIATVIQINNLKKDPVLWYFYTSETALDTKTLDFLADEVSKGVKFSSVSEIQAAVVKFFKPADKRLENDVAKTKFSF